MNCKVCTLLSAALAGMIAGGSAVYSFIDGDDSDKNDKKSKRENNLDDVLVEENIIIVSTRVIWTGLLT